jgi:hypothetical protein
MTLPSGKVFRVFPSCFGCKTSASRGSSRLKSTQTIHADSLTSNTYNYLFLCEKIIIMQKEALIPHHT